jgi:nucleotide-binding universal stress UspA family protein
MLELEPQRAVYRHVACMVDRSESSRAALREAQHLAAGAGARLSALHIDPWIPLAMSCTVWVPDLAELRECASAWLRQELRDLGADEALPVVVDSPAAACKWARRRGVDLIVAPRGRGALRRLLSGNTAGYLSRRAPCPVLILGAEGPRALLAAAPALPGGSAA